MDLSEVRKVFLVGGHDVLELRKVPAVKGRKPVKGSIPRLEEHGQSFGDAQRGLPSQGETHQPGRRAVER